MSTNKNHQFSELEEQSKQLQISALNAKLALSVDQRIDAHENARELINDLVNSKKVLNAGSKEAS